MRDMRDFIYYFMTEVLPAIILMVIFVGGIPLFASLNLQTENIKKIGTTADGAEIKRHTNWLGRTIKAGDFEIVMPEGYNCRVAGYADLISKFTSGQDGFTRLINFEGISIDMRIPRNRKIIERIVGHKVASSEDLKQFKEACLDQLIKHNRETR